MEIVLDWLKSNWGWVVAILGFLFEVTPIKINPISFICNWIGKRITISIKNDIKNFKSDVKKDIDGVKSDIDGVKTDIDNLKHITDSKYNELNKEITTTQTSIDMQRAANIKAHVLDFANSCRNGIKHSKEEFTYVLSENDEYEKLIEKHNLINNVYQEDFAYIKEIYRECLRENKFLA